MARQTNDNDRASVGLTGAVFTGPTTEDNHDEEPEAGLSSSSDTHSSRLVDSSKSETTRSGPTQSSSDDVMARLTENQGSVERAKWSVVVMLLLTAGLVVTSTYIFLRNEEMNTFENEVRET